MMLTLLAAVVTVYSSGIYGSALMALYAIGWLSGKYGPAPYHRLRRTMEPWKKPNSGTVLLAVGVILMCGCPGWSLFFGHAAVPHHFRERQENVALILQVGDTEALVKERLGDPDSTRIVLDSQGESDILEYGSWTVVLHNGHVESIRHRQAPPPSLPRNSN